MIYMYHGPGQRATPPDGPRAQRRCRRSGGIVADGSRGRDDEPRPGGEERGGQASPALDVSAGRGRAPGEDDHARGEVLAQDRGGGERAVAKRERAALGADLAVHGEVQPGGIAARQDGRAGRGGAEPGRHVMRGGQRAHLGGGVGEIAVGVADEDGPATVGMETAPHGGEAGQPRDRAVVDEQARPASRGMAGRRSDRTRRW
jgi:hypothetical protein